MTELILASDWWQRRSPEWVALPLTFAAGLALASLMCLRGQPDMVRTWPAKWDRHLTLPAAVLYGLLAAFLLVVAAVGIFA